MLVPLGLDPLGHDSLGVGPLGPGHGWLWTSWSRASLVMVLLVLDHLVQTAGPFWHPGYLLGLHIGVNVCLNAAALIQG